MKAVHSFRSEVLRPALEAVGGEEFIKLEAVSMALSACSIRRYFDEFECITDDAGYSLVKRLELPYTKIVNVGDSFCSDPSFLVHSKFVAYESKTPFLHFDNDLFLWAPLSEDVLKAPIVAFHGETHKWPFYEHLIEISKELPYNFEYPETYPLNKTPLNMAIFGGTDTDTINLYAEEVLDIVINKLNGFNLPEDKKVIAWNCIQMFEQLLASYIIQSKFNKLVKFVVSEKDALTENDKTIKTITHIGHQKRVVKSTQQIESALTAKMLIKLQEIDTATYAKVVKFLKTDNEPLLKLMELK